jgi:hypothetical protein
MKKRTMKEKAVPLFGLITLVGAVIQFLVSNTFGMLLAALLSHKWDFISANVSLSTTDIEALAVCAIFFIFFKPKSLFTVIMSALSLGAWTWAFLQDPWNWSAQEYLSRTFLMSGSTQAKAFALLAYLLVLASALLNAFFSRIGRNLMLKVYLQIWKRSNRFLYAAMTGDIVNFRKEARNLYGRDRDPVYDRNPLHWASYFGHFDLAREIMKDAPALCFKKDNEGKLPVDLARSEGHANIVREIEGLCKKDR